MNLTEFLTARLDEDEAAARAAASDDPRSRSWTAGEGGYPVAGPLVEDGWHVAVVPPGATWGQVRHIGRHDPARVLREVEAKRRLLEQFRLRGDSVRATVKPATGGVWDDLLCLLAAVYSDHPDYRTEWEWRP